MWIGEVINKQYGEDNYYEKVFFPELQKELRKNPQLKRFRGYSIKITDDREVEIGGKNGGNIDFYHPRFETQYSTPDPKKQCSWTFEYYYNFVYETPKGYEGKLYVHTEPYKDKEENEYIRRYMVPHIPAEELDDSNYYRQVGTMINSEGKEVPVYAYCNIEYVFVIKKLVFGKCVERHYCNNVKYYDFGYFNPYITVGSNDRLLVQQSNWAAVYDLKNDTFKYIVASRLSTGKGIFTSREGDKLYWYNGGDLKEYVCDWSKNSISKETGNIMEDVYAYD